jgi:hypothetical protein
MNIDKQSPVMHSEGLPSAGLVAADSLKKWSNHK